MSGLRPTPVSSGRPTYLQRSRPGKKEAKPEGRSRGATDNRARASGQGGAVIEGKGWGQRARGEGGPTLKEKATREVNNSTERLAEVQGAHERDKSSSGLQSLKQVGKPHSGIYTLLLVQGGRIPIGRG
jgi:hypothetical protein